MTPEILAQSLPSTPKKAYLFPNIHGGEPALKRHYDSTFKPGPAYIAGLPDMTETVNSVEGSDVPIQQVGVSGFRLPLRFETRSGETLTLEGRVSGTVSLEAGSKGINMSRILRTFYQHRDSAFRPETLGEILQDYLLEVGSLTARLKVQFNYPMLLPSLRSALEGYQFYGAAYTASLDPTGVPRLFLELDFVYSSACPCSAELAEHARDTRAAYAIPHSQRSKARIQVEIRRGAVLTIEDVVEHAREALKTETQVLVKREDEQAFAELNGAYPKFVEDAARLLHERLQADCRIRDFLVACSHQESLHSHDAVSVICKGVQGGFRPDFMDFASLAC